MPSLFFCTACGRNVVPNTQVCLYCGAAICETPQCETEVQTTPVVDDLSEDDDSIFTI